MIKNIKLNKKYLFILLTVMAIGVFLRTYHFEDWLRFHKDQARDAKLISDIVQGKKILPLLGPVVGNTKFKLGPIFYYFEYASAKIFGDTPDKLAYPDLFFSILSVVLLFFLFKKYFTDYLSLLLTTLFATSFYIVRYSRFAWNPNSQPFFLMLFLCAFLEIITAKSDKIKFLWAALAGIALGVGVQLHALFLFTIPPVAILFFIYLKRKKIISWKLILAIISIALFLNIPQIIYEFESHGQNTHEFIRGVILKTTKIGTIPAAVQCQMQANSFILTSLGDDGDCSAVSHIQQPFIAQSLYLIFNLGGFILLIYFLRKEKDTGKKLFLYFFVLSLSIVFVLSIFLFYTLAARYFMILEIVPFFFLGLWLKLILKMKTNIKIIVCAVIVIPLFWINFSSLSSQATSLTTAKKSSSRDAIDLTLSEARFIAIFISQNANQNGPVYIDGRNITAKYVLESLNYFPETTNLSVISYDKNRTLEKNGVLFAFDSALNAGTNLGSEEKQNYIISSSASYGRFSIFKLIPKQPMQ